MRELLSDRTFWLVVVTMAALLAYLAWMTHDARKSK